MYKLVLVTLFALNLNAAHGLTLRLFFEPEVSSEQQDRLEMIARRIEQVVASEAFENKARENSYKCFDSKNLPRGVKTIDDVLVDLAHKDAVVRIAFFTSNNSVVGSTSGNLISFNTTFFERNTDARVANTLLHESLHSIGYGHCGKNNIRIFPKIKRSVPYKFGQFAQELY